MITRNAWASFFGRVSIKRSASWAGLGVSLPRQTRNPQGTRKSSTVCPLGASDILMNSFFSSLKHNTVQIEIVCSINRRLVLEELGAFRLNFDGLYH